MKTCFKCKKVKPLSDFYKHPQMADGHLNKCKECNKLDVRENRKKNIEYYREYDRSRANQPQRADARHEYQKSERGRSVLSKAKALYIKNNAKKRSSHTKIRNGIRDGIIFPLPCEICGHEKTEAHHSHYDLPLHVTWLCSKHHAKLHKEFRNQLRKNI
jgi:hypothetical protein